MKGKTTMQLVRFDPFRELQKVERDMNKLWENGWGMTPLMAETTAMDLYQEDGKLVAEISLPNFKKDEVKVNADEGMLEVSAEHKEEEEKKNKRKYFFRESSNSYFRRVALPEGVETDKADANFDNGVLRIMMPMTEPKQTKAIAIK
jgi:HSP20 family protein